MTLLCANEAKLQKKGVGNMTLGELKQWIQVCERNSEKVSHKKARKSWRESQKEALERVAQLST